MDLLSQEIGAKSPKTIILISPHGSMFRDSISLLYEESVLGDLGGFSAPDIKFNKKIDKDLTDKLYDLSMERNIPIVKSNKSSLKSYSSTFELDHGAMIPLYFIDKYYKDYNIVHITYAPLENSKLYEFGKLIKEATKDSNTVLIGSGDLSHRLKDSGPYGYHPDGPIFDKKVLDFLQIGDKEALLDMDKTLIQNAGECGMRSILILIGAMDDYDFKGQLLSYEDTFGVGYGVMKFDLNSEKENPYVRLARENLSHYLKTGTPLNIVPSYITDEMKIEQKGVFVTLYKHGALRGCIGTIFPTTNSIYEEIIRNSIEAGISDPRFKSVEMDELKDISFSVDILDSPKAAKLEDLDPKKYGIILSTRFKKALLLPNIQGVDTVEEQIQITKDKAGIRQNEKFNIESFKVTRYEGNSND